MADKLKIVQVLSSIRKQKDGDKALEVLYILTYFAAEDINVEMLSGSANCKNDNELKSVLRLLTQHSLIRLNQSQSVINIDKTMQELILSTMLDNKKFEYLEKAFETIITNSTYPNHLCHVSSVWRHIARYPQLIEKFNEIPSYTIHELTKQNRYEEAIEYGWKALNFFIKSLGENHSGTRLLKVNIGVVLGMARKHEHALELLVPMFKADITHLARIQARDALIRIARQLVQDSEFDKALKIYEQSLLCNKKVSTENDDMILFAWHDYAVLLMETGKCSQASTILKDVLRRRKQIGSDDDDIVLALQTSIAQVLAKQGNFDGALEIFHLVYRRRKLIFGENDLKTLALKREIAQVFLHQGRFDEALLINNEMEKDVERICGKDHPLTLAIQEDLSFDDFHLHTLHSAAKRGCLSTVESATESGTDLNAQDSHRKTLLYYAAEGGNIDIVKYLLKSGVIYNTKSKEGKTPLQAARNSEVKNLLDSVSKLLKYVKEGNCEQVSKIITNHKEIVNAKDDDGSNSLHWAAHNGFQNICKILLSVDADATHVTNKGNTPLHIATSKGHGEIVEILLQSISREKFHNFINAKTAGSGSTAIHVAVKNGSLNIVKTLLEHGAIYNIKDKLGKKPLDLSKDQSIADLLKLANKLFAAAINGDWKIINELKGLEPDDLVALSSARNSQGNTLLQVLVINKHEKVASKLTEMLKKGKKLKSASDSSECLFDRLERLKQVTESHIKFAMEYFNDLMVSPQRFDADKNPHPWFTLKQGSHYLESVHRLIEVYEKSGEQLTDGNDVRVIRESLLELGFDPKHITSGRTNEAYNGLVKCFVSKGQNTVYHDLLHRNTEEGVKKFLETVETGINSRVKMIFDSLKRKLESLLCERLLKAVDKNNLSELEYLIKKGEELNLTKVYEQFEPRPSPKTDRVNLVNHLMTNTCYPFTVYTNNVALPVATCKKLEGTFEVLLKHVSNEKLNDLINGKTGVSRGATLLHVAVKNGNLDIVKWLFNHGAIYNVSNEDDKIPLDLSRDVDTTKFLKLVDELFEDAKNGNIEIINKLRDVGAGDFSALTNARNDKGDTLLYVVITNKFKHVESKFIELFKKSDQISHSLSHLNCSLSELADIENEAKRFVYSSLTYMRKMKRTISQTEDSLNKNPRPFDILEKTTFYLLSAYDLVEKYNEYIKGEIIDANVKTVNDTLKDLQFHQDHISREQADEGRGKMTERFASKGQGAKYYDMLKSREINDKKLFVEIIERDIHIPVRNFFNSIREKIQSILYKNLLKAIESNDNWQDENSIFWEVEDCILWGVDVNSTDDNGGTPLHFAVNNGNKNIVKTLLDNWAYPNQVTNKGNTPLHIATSKGDEKMIEILLKHVASFYKLNEFINVKTSGGGTTALHVAAKNGSLNVVKLLLEYGAVYDAKNKEGKKPVELAKNRNIVNLFKLIGELFASANKGDAEIVAEKLGDAAKTDEFLAISNARTDFGENYTVLQTAIRNRYENSESKFVEYFKNPGKIKTLPVPRKPKSKLSKYRAMKEVTNFTIENSKLYILQLKSISKSPRSDKLFALKNGYLYLRNIHIFLDIYKRLNNGTTIDEDVEMVKNSLAGLEFKSEQVALFTDEFYNDTKKVFDTEILRGTKYYELLYGESTESFAIFVSHVEQKIEASLRYFYGTILTELLNIETENLRKSDKKKQSKVVAEEEKSEGEVNSQKIDRFSFLLQHAVVNEDYRAAFYLLENGADPTVVSDVGSTMLHVATYTNNIEIVKLLLKYVSPDKLKNFVNAQSVRGLSALTIAVTKGLWEIVACLSAHGASFDDLQLDKINENESPPKAISSDNNQNFTNVSFGQTADELSVNSAINGETKFAEPAFNDPPVVHSAKSFNGETVDKSGQANELIKKDEITAKINFERDEIRPLARDKIWRLDEIDRLKESADSYVKSSESYLPMLRKAAQLNRTEKNLFPWATLKAGSLYLESVYNLVDAYKKCVNGAIEDENVYAINEILNELGFDPLHITTGYTEEAYDGKIECFVSKGCGTKYYELLHSDVKKDVGTFVELIESKIDNNAKKFFQTMKQKSQSIISLMLFQAIERNKVSELRNYARDNLIINLKNSEGKSPLHLAVSKGNLMIANILLKNGANVYQINEQGDTALHLASSKGNKRMIEGLLQHVGMNEKLKDFVNAQTIASGDTSLHVAASHGFLHIVEILLKNGAIYNLKNKYNEKPIDVCHDENINNLLKLIDQLFVDAKIGNSKIIQKIKTQTFDINAVINCRNHQSKSITDVAISNKNQSFADKLETIVKK